MTTPLSIADLEAAVESPEILTLATPEQLRLLALEALAIRERAARIGEVAWAVEADFAAAFRIISNFAGPVHGPVSANVNAHTAAASLAVAIGNERRDRARLEREQVTAVAEEGPSHRDVERAGLVGCLAGVLAAQDVVRKVRNGLVGMGIEEGLRELERRETDSLAAFEGQEPT